MVTHEMLAAGWAMLRREKPNRSILGPGPGLKEAYEAMRVLEPKDETDDGLTLDQVTYLNERAAARRKVWDEHRIIQQIKEVP